MSDLLAEDQAAYIEELGDRGLRADEWPDAAREMLTHGETLEVDAVDAEGVRRVRVWAEGRAEAVASEWPEGGFAPVECVLIVTALAKHMRTPPPERPRLPLPWR
jgi:hypothetical protein